jgi:hypothetical protein
MGISGVRDSSMLEAFAAAVRDSQFAAFVGGSSWAYPVANLLHLLGLVLLVGGIGIVDLRLAGLFRPVPLAPLMQALTPLAIAGFVLLALTGPVLFASDAMTLSQSPALGWKLALIVIAGLNAIAFRWVRRSKSGEATPLERSFALASISLWLVIAALGRMIAYT